MGFTKTMGMAAAIALLTACSSSQNRAAKAEEKVAKERLALVEKYQKCVADAAGDQQKAAACESYLKAAESLR